MRRLLLFGIAVLLPSQDNRSVQRVSSQTLTEVARWGGSDDDTIFSSRIGSAALHHSGLLVVTFPQLGRVLITRLGSRRLQQIGRMGQGPGEFTRPGSVGWKGDSLWIWDSALLRLSWLDTQGHFLGSERSQESGGIYPLLDGSWYRFLANELGDTSAKVVRVSPDRRRTSNIVSYSWPKAPPLNIKVQQNAIVGVQPFLNQANVVVSATSNNLFVVEPLQKPGAVRLRLVSSAGQTLTDRQLMLPLQPLTDSFYNAALSVWRERGGPEHRSLPPDVLQRSIYRPKYLPTVRGRMVAAEETLWLQAGPETSSFTTWVLVSPAGEVVGSVTGPPQLRLLAATGANIVGALTTETGVEALVQLRLGK